MWRIFIIGLAWRLAILVMVSGTALFAIVYAVEEEREDRHIEAAFRRMAEDHASAVRRRVEQDMAALRTVEGLFAASPALGRADFAVFAKRLLGQHTAIFGLAWFPRINHADRAAFEAAARTAEFPDFQISETDAQGRLVRRAPARTYFPLLFSEPPVTHFAAGFDPASEPTRADLLAMARDTGMAVRSPAVRLINGDMGLIAYLPYFGPHGVPVTLAERRDTLRGLFMAAFRLRDIFREAFRGKRIPAEVLVIARSKDAEQVLYRTETTEPLAAEHDMVTVSLGFFGAEEWVLAARPTRAFHGTAHTALPGLILGAGLVLTALIAGLVHLLVSRREAIKRQVQERTWDLARSNARFEAMLRAAPEGVVVIDAKGAIQQFNTAATRIFGHAGDEVIGRNVSLLMPEPYHSAHDGYLAHFLETGEKKVIGIGRDVAGLRSDGSTFPLRLSVGHTEVGGQNFFIGFVSDITAEREAQAEIRRLSLAVEQSPASVIITDDEGRITYVNQAFTTVTGYQATEVIGRNPRLLQSGRTGRSVYEAMWSTVLAGQIWRGEMEDRRKDGSAVWISGVLSPVRNREGRITHFIGLQEDITKRKEAEIAVLAAKEAAEDANRLKTEFLRTMSHELRTPLTAMLGLLTFIKTPAMLAKIPLDTLQKKLGATQLPEAPDDMAPGEREVFQKVSLLGARMNVSGENLLEIINDILDLSKIEAGALTLASRRFSLNEVVRDALATAYSYAQGKDKAHLALRLEVPAPPLWGWADPGKVGQILRNLLSNAVKFTDNGVVVIAAGRDGTELWVEVRDQGCGIPEAMLDHIFESFRQVDGSVSRKAGGTGLGLAITRKLVELMDGTITVASKEGEGSVFRVTLPAADQSGEGDGEDTRGG
jgi:PAS domain S-box-containing protein